MRFQDLSGIPDAAYEIAAMINSGNYNNILVYEFHEEVDSTKIWNCEEGLEGFRERSKDSYAEGFFSLDYVDEFPATIHIVIKIANEWFIVERCGFNYYGGFGPTGILKLREVCLKKNIKIFISREPFKTWVKENLASNYGQLDIASKGKKGTNYQADTKDKKEFEKIIQTFQYLCVEMQRRKDDYKDLGEENIRDRMLPVINTCFNGRGNGEAKNGKGKTDVLIRTKDGLNEHIFELKVWGGIKTIDEAAEQLLGYLSWHNNYAGIIIFSRKSDFSEILNKIEVYIKSKHSNLLVDVRRKNEFRFSLGYPSDKKNGFT